MIPREPGPANARAERTARPTRRRNAALPSAWPDLPHPDLDGFRWELGPEPSQGPKPAPSTGGA